MLKAWIGRNNIGEFDTLSFCIPSSSSSHIVRVVSKTSCSGLALISVVLSSRYVKIFQDVNDAYICTTHEHRNVLACSNLFSYKCLKHLRNFSALTVENRVQ